MIVVIPSIRTINTEYIKCLLDSDAEIIVVDDTDEERIKPVSDNMKVLHYSDRKRMLGSLESCIPRKNGACRDFGLWYAYVYGEKDETVICLDDDCEILSDYRTVAENSLGIKNLPLAQTKNRFYNPLDLYNLDMEIYPRGFPYEERGKKPDYNYNSSVEGNVVFNLGLWRGVFDVNAIDKLYLSQYSFDTKKLRFGQVVVQKGALVSLCSMNMILKREVIPAIYQLPMNEPIIPEWVINRYGDIWGGYICKKLADIKGDLVSVGEPMINHYKEDTQPEILKNIKQEHYSHIVNIAFCDILDLACADIKPSDYLGMYRELVDNLKKLSVNFPVSIKPYLDPTVVKMEQWVKALNMNVE